MSNFNQFDCKLKWRKYDNDDASEYDVLYNSNLLIYQVRQEYDLRFFCWINSCKIFFMQILVSKYRFFKSTSLFLYN